MAFYKYSNHLQQNNDAAFDTANGIGKTAPYSGIYRCPGCGSEYACNKGDPLPPQNHHQHSPAQGQVRWVPIVICNN